MVDIVVVNASPLLTDAAVQAKIGPLQTQYDRDFKPAWGDRVPAVTVRFAPMSGIAGIPADAWAIFLNKHSNDPGALGWHDDDGRVFSRVFAGDCLRFGLDWGVTLSHELLEMALDPDVTRTWPMPDGRLAALEAADACEADALAYDVDGCKVSDFVLPAYFSTGAGPWDFRGHLTGPCPTLTPGGYMSLSKGGQWTQIQKDRADGLAGRRALMQGSRRLKRMS